MDLELSTKFPLGAKVYVTLAVRHGLNDEQTHLPVTVVGSVKDHIDKPGFQGMIRVDYVHPEGYSSYGWFEASQLQLV